MNETDTTPKIIAPPTAPPAFPITNLQIVPQGVLVAMVLANNISINCLIDEDTMNKLCRQWLEHRKQQRDQLETIRAVQKSRTS